MLSYMGRMSCMLTTSLPTLNATATATKFPKVLCDSLRQRHFSPRLRSYPSIFCEKGCCGSNSVLRRKNWSTSGNMRPLLHMYGLGSDSSSDLPLSDENESHIKEHTAAKDGIWQWLQKFITERSAEKEKLRNNLKRYGLAGVLSYGLLNTFYYLVTFLFVWFYVAPSEGSLGFGPAAQRFVKLFSMVWAGSQVTKLFRAAGALALAPFVDRGLNWYTDRFNFKSRGKAFGFIVGACVVLAVSVFLIITTLSV
ncbi:hypothetical protein MPTK1_7g18080 [Marchantia polymorpha subsp. ruderalis]|uniref:Uncharacterized protein n=2 Tax=Marchantia polymorpha TaxID=3197 RepID=A0AAF6C0Z2_MARPO|nr:hypothetical protein MARPO_0102s0032 [Marchantia polymorpha]BBN17926.1 hypothetical protein Mp_7g18080 [Marchantia polymorpha subsp. ruderalis]|eukprot:PTQ32164.1 hypothetical protein MARPO_0102s0032 [Marchantia polymorpha]